VEAPQGIHAFLRAYYHFKSADWKQNKPFKLASFTAGELAKMPTYYIMDLDKGMAETVAPEMPSAAEIAGCKWLPDKELAVYATEWNRTGFQGGLQWYRCTTGKYTAELETLSGRTIDVPACFIAGKSDWAVYYTPGALERMQTTVCTRWHGTHLVEDAGHWGGGGAAGASGKIASRIPFRIARGETRLRCRVEIDEIACAENRISGTYRTTVRCSPAVVGRP
jgi:hypothetical protein